MKLTIEVDCDNAAFHDEVDGTEHAMALGVEVGRVLEVVPERIADGGISGMLMDSYGNTVGFWRLDG